MATTTRANGIDIQHHGVTGTSAARQLAAGLDRSHPAVSRIKPATKYDAKVWLETDDPPRQDFEVPDGWRVVGTFVGGNGGVCLRLVREDR